MATSVQTVLAGISIRTMIIPRDRSERRWLLQLRLNSEIAVLPIESGATRISAVKPGKTHELCNVNIGTNFLSEIVLGAYPASVRPLLWVWRSHITDRPFS